MFISLPKDPFGAQQLSAETRLLACYHSWEDTLFPILSSRKIQNCTHCPTNFLFNIELYLHFVCDAMISNKPW